MERLSFPQKLKAAIDADPVLTEAGLAQSAGLDKTTIRQMIAKDRSPRMETAEKICAALGTTVEEFMAVGRSEEERSIARLVSQLSVENRRQIVGYGEALLESQRHSPHKSDEESQ